MVVYLFVLQVLKLFLRVMAEGPTQEETDEYVNRIVKVVEKEMGTK